MATDDDPDDWFETLRKPPPWSDYVQSAGEITAWTSTVIASGVLGNASYDGLKMIMRWLRGRSASGAATHPGGPHGAAEIEMQAALEALATVSVRQRMTDLGLPTLPVTVFRVTSSAWTAEDTTLFVTAPAYEAEVRIPYDGLTVDSIRVTIRGIAPTTAGPGAR